jgi:polynucleotide 5'-hydroxyl-kinase GRC3/NOL9
MSDSADPIVSPQWSQLEVSALRGTVMVIGASDTGKSTVARYLFAELCRAGVRAAYQDGDVGQSTLGLPTTMSVQVATAAGDDRFPPRGPRATYFVGSTTPRGHMLPVVVGAFRLREQAVSLGAEAVVVDTTGLVDASEGGRALKQWKIELLAPALVIALQRGRELEPVLWPVRLLRAQGRPRLVEWRVSPHAAARSREARIEYRRARLAGYFRRARPVHLALNKMAVYDLERLAAGALLAFQDEAGFSLGLGCVQEIDRRAWTVVAHTPLPGLDGVKSVRFGLTRWDLGGGREL